MLDAIRPGMATIPNAMMLCASSPYARKGALWDAHRRHFGKDGDPILVWQADTRTMNPTVAQRVVDEAMDRDPASAAAEYLAQFRSDIESYISRDALEACVTLGCRERPPVSGTQYSGFVDPSGGSADSFTLAIGHRQDNVAVIDALREVKPPFSPESVVAEFAALLKTYGISQDRRRPLRGRVAARAVSAPRHKLRAGQQAQERPLPGRAAADQQPQDRAARSPAPDHSARGPGAAHRARRTRQHRPRTQRSRRRGQRRRRGCRPPRAAERLSG